MATETVLLHLVRRIGRRSWMVASLCVCGVAILFGIGYAITLGSVQQEVGIDDSGNRDVPGDVER